MNREWADLLEFPNYQISNYGEFANKRTDREVRPSCNQVGHAKVTLIQDGRQATRSVAQLVAQTFIEPDRLNYDTPIHIDGDLLNCRADNLMWRPRWFAIKYHRQFNFDTFHLPGPNLIDIESGETYRSVKEVCLKHGLYFQDVIKSYIEKTFVPITYQEFRMVI